MWKQEFTRGRSKSAPQTGWSFGKLGIKHLSTQRCTNFLWPVLMMKDPRSAIYLHHNLVRYQCKNTFFTTVTTRGQQCIFPFAHNCQKRTLPFSAYHLNIYIVEQSTCDPNELSSPIRTEIVGECVEECNYTRSCYNSNHQLVDGPTSGIAICTNSSWNEVLDGFCGPG